MMQHGTFKTFSAKAIDLYVNATKLSIKTLRRNHVLFMMESFWYMDTWLCTGYRIAAVRYRPSHGHRIEINIFMYAMNITCLLLLSIINGMRPYTCYPDRHNNRIGWCFFGLHHWLHKILLSACRCGKPADMAPCEHDESPAEAMLEVVNEKMWGADRPIHDVQVPVKELSANINATSNISNCLYVIADDNSLSLVVLSMVAWVLVALGAWATNILVVTSR